MKVITFARYEWNGTEYVKVAEESCEYEGPVAQAGGGPSRQQLDSANAEMQLAKTATQNSTDMMNIWKNAYGQIQPFASQRLSGGLPFYNSLTGYASGSLGQAYKPAWASLNRQLASYGPLPSGFAQSARAALMAQQARDFDSQMVGNLLMNEQAKSQAAGLLTGQQAGANPLGWSGQAMTGFNNVMQAPLASPGWGATLGGILGGGGQMAGGLGSLAKAGGMAALF